MWFPKIIRDFRLPRWQSDKESTCQCRFNHWVGRSPGGGNGNPLQYSCLKYSTDRRAWRATVHGVTRSWTRWSDWVCTHIRAFTFTLWATFNVQSKINTISKGAANSNNTKTKQLQRIRVALVVKNLPANTGDIRDAGSIPRSGRSPGGGHGNPLQYYCLETPMDRGAWQATVHRITQSWTWLKWLSTHTHTGQIFMIIISYRIVLLP